MLLNGAPAMVTALTVVIRGTVVPPTPVTTMRRAVVSSRSPRAAAVAISMVL